MKKFDIVTILLVLLISISFYVIYWGGNAGNELFLRISYSKLEGDKVIYEKKLGANSKIIVDISTEDSFLKVEIDDDGKRSTLMRAISNTDRIENVVEVTGYRVQMVWANCPKQECMLMKSSKNLPLPIICTNGIIVELNYNKSDYIIRV